MIGIGKHGDTEIIEVRIKMIKMTIGKEIDRRAKIMGK